jgi:hypothetical protein
MKIASCRALTRVVVLAVLACVPPMPALAKPTPTVPHACPHWTANVTRGRIGEVTFDPQTGRELTTVPVDDGRLVLSRPYKALGDATARYEGNTYAVHAGTEFALSCYGQSVSRPNELNGALYLQAGRASVSTASRRPGAIKTFEALLNPVGATAQHLAVSRTLTRTGGSVSLNATGPKVDITPELGANAGHCIYYNEVRLASSFSERAQTFLLKVTIVR